MARPSLFSHPKFARLTHRLGSKATALGSLELIWEAAYGAGEAAIGDADTVEAIADWRGTRGELAGAMVSIRFLDQGADGLLSVHDLEHHAPEYVHKRWKREEERRKRGESIKATRQSASGQRQVTDQSASGQRPVTDRDLLVSDQHSPLPTPLTHLPSPTRTSDIPTVEERDPDPAGAPVRVATGRPESDARAHTNGATKIWTGWDWRENFGRAWTKKYGGVRYGGAGDAEAGGKMRDVLDPLSDAERLDAQARAPQMFQEFLSSEKPETVRRRHPFSFFVQEWGGLRVPAVSVKPQFEPIAVRQERERQERIEAARDERVMDMLRPKRKVMSPQERIDEIKSRNGGQEIK